MRRFFTNLLSPQARPPRKPRVRPTLESLEERWCPAGIGVFVNSTQTTVITVTGTEQTDKVQVTLDTGAPDSLLDDRLVVTANLGGTAFQQSVSIWKMVNGSL